MNRFTLLLALMLWAAPGWAAFAYKGTFTVQTSQMPASETDFPFLIYWTDNVLKQTGGGGQVTDAQGDDIRPYSTSDCSTTALTYQRFAYDGTAGTIGMWVKSTGGVGHTIYLCVGDSGVTTDGSSTSTWNSGYKAVWTLGDGTTLSGTDGTSSGNNLSTTGSVTAAAGQVNGAANFPGGGTDYLRDGSTSGLAITNAFTISFWFKPADLTQSQIYMFTKADESSGGTGVFLLWEYVNNQVEFFATDYSGTDPRTSSGVTIGDTNWHQVAYTYDGAGWFKTLDGSRSTINASITFALTGASDTPTTLGGTWSGGSFLSANAVGGRLAKFKISDTARSENWMTSEYNGENNQSSFWGSVSFASTSAGGGNSSYYRQQLQRVLR